MDSPPAIRYMVQHVLNQLDKHRSRFASNPAPLILGVQGPQGSGKTFLTTRLRDVLSGNPHQLGVALLSIDDLYLPHDNLVELARSHPQNALLKGRGQPGTHDVELGTSALDRLKAINEPGADVVMLPIFDKSLHGGEGDRLPESLPAVGPIDVVIIEGWCTGFYPISPEEIDEKWSQAIVGLENKSLLEKYRKEDVLEVNEKLKAYVAWWALFDAFIQIKPVESSPYVFIYNWRLQQEHNMKAHNGGKGMSDEEVTSFVDRYIPGYVFFGGGVERGYTTADGHALPPPWIGSGLKVIIGEQREVLQCISF